VRNPALSGNPPQEGQRSGGQQQTKAAKHTALSVQQPNAAHSQTSQGCPAAHEPRLDCNTVSAIANVRQADAAEWFNNLAVAEIGVGLFTAFVAALAARWAKTAAEAGVSSYRAFVAAEDAHLVLDFWPRPHGSSTTSEGVTTRNWTFEVTVSNVGRSAARLQQLTINSFEGSVARSFGETLKPDETTKLPEWVWFLAAEGENPEDKTASIELTYATALHPVTRLHVEAGIDLKYANKPTAYVASSRTGRPKAK
jgi:hypothetical protein